MIIAITLNAEDPGTECHHTQALPKVRARTTLLNLISQWSEMS